MTLRLLIIFPSDTCSSTIIGSNSIMLPNFFVNSSIESPDFSSISVIAWMVGGPLYGGLWAK
jgi:hypothetical protein